MPPVVLGGAALAIGAFGASKDRSAARDATSANERSTAASQAFIEQQQGQAREDVLTLSPIAQANRLAGFGGALDIRQQFLPQQLQAFQQGNITAQDIQQQGLAGQQAAILGTGLPQFQAPIAQQLPSFANIQLPEFQTSQQALAAPPQQQATPEQIQQALRAASQGALGRVRGIF